jgi:hypothetical protein
MRVKLNYLIPLLATGAAAVAVAAAPIAAAAPGPLQQSCTQIGADSECQSPGNVQINDSPPPVNNFDPYGGEGFLLGGFGGGGFHGGGGGHR